MISDQKDNLFQLIKSLTKSEKRQFKLYVGRMGSNNDSKFLNLFNLLDTETKSDSKGIISIACSVAKQLVKCALGFLHPLVRADASRPVALREVEVLTEVRPVFFRHRFGAPLAALVRHTAVVENAIEAGAQILVAVGADITAAGLAVDCPFRTAVVAMPVHRRYPPSAWPSAGLGFALASLAWLRAWRICSAVFAPVRPCFSRR